MTKTNNKGFSLIELLVVIAILGVLTMIAVPTYRNYVRQANRSDAQAALMENAQYMERYFTTHNTYDDNSDPPVLPTTATANGSYTLDFIDPADNSDDLAANTYIIYADPQGGQTADDCGVMSINQLGNKTPNNCW